MDKIKYFKKSISMRIPKSIEIQIKDCFIADGSLPRLIMPEFPYGNFWKDYKVITFKKK